MRRMLFYIAARCIRTEGRCGYMCTHFVQMIKTCSKSEGFGHYVAINPNGEKLSDNFHPGVFCQIMTRGGKGTLDPELLLSVQGRTTQIQTDSTHPMLPKGPGPIRYIRFRNYLEFPKFFKIRDFVYNFDDFSRFFEIFRFF